MKVKFFYRDGDNHKCVWVQHVDDEVWNDFINDFSSDGDSFDDYLDKNYDSSDTWMIYEFNLEMNDIPLIKQHGVSDMDHPYVSIIEYGEDL